MTGQPPVRQQGAALLALILIIVTGSIWMLLGNLNATAIQNQRDRHDARVLAEAKEALIAYAMTHSDLNSAGEFGFLPCPDRHGGGAIPEGGSDGNCGPPGTNTLGRLPWRTLGLEPLKDSAGECLWYALSSQYRQDSALVNADTNGTFEIYSRNTGDLVAGAGAGDTYENRPVAVIFAPGAPVGDQNRHEPDPDETPECGGNYNAENYLDSWDFGNPPGLVENHGVDAEDGIDNLVSGGEADRDRINDKLVFITRADIWKAINRRRDMDYLEYPDPTEFKRLTAWVSACLVQYAEQTGGDPANFSLPYPASPSLVRDVDARDYRNNALYRSIDPDALDDYYVDSYISPPLFGRLPYDIGNSAAIKQVSLSADSFIEDCNLSDSGLVEEEVRNNYEKYRNMWQHWKDHFFYLVSDLYAPKDEWERIPDPDNALTAFCDSLPRSDWPPWWNDFLQGYCNFYFDNNPAATIPRTCEATNCISIDDDSGPYYAAIVIFAGQRHEYGSCGVEPGVAGVHTVQRRLNFSYDVAGTESNDDRKRVCNYLEPPNLANFIDWQNERITYLDTAAENALVLESPAVVYGQEHNDIYYCLRASPDPGVTPISEITECF